MGRPNLPEGSSGEIRRRKKLLELKVLRDSLRADKKAADSFLSDEVPSPLLFNIKEVVKELKEKTRQLQSKGAKKTAQDKVELRNLEWLQKEIPKLKHLDYLKLLQLLYKFPGRIQIGMDGSLLEFLRMSSHFAHLDKYIPADSYVTNSWSFKRYLTDCIAFSRLRKLQLDAAERASEDESPLEKTLQIEREFSIIPDQFLLETRLGGKGAVGIFKGMDLVNNIPVAIKYLTQQEKESVHESQFRRMGYQEAKRRFDREAHAFEKLEKHRQAKEQAVSMLVEQARRQIDEGKLENNQSKVKAGISLLKQGDDLLCDRHFVKAYCLATGQLSRFKITERGFYRDSPENVAFMVMEYIDGVNLETLIREYEAKQSKMPIKVFVPIIESVLEALDYCHTEGIIHRDIRPDNILITKNFKVRLTNLGRAKVEDMTQLTAQGVFVGTPGYAAPEGILQGVEHRRDFASAVTGTDHRFDLYSLGCVAYEMLIGKPPFQSDKTDIEQRDEEILNKHMKEEPLPPARLRPEIPDGVNLLVLKMLAKNPAHRFQSARETLFSLRATLSLGQKAGEFTNKLMEQLRASTIQERVFPVRQKNKGLRIALSFFSFLFVFGAIVWYFQREKIDPVLKRVYTQARQKLVLFIQKDQKEKNEIEIIQKDLERQKQNLLQKWQSCNELYLTLVRDYPVERGYPAVNISIGGILKKSRETIDSLGEIIVQSRKKLEEEGGISTLNWLYPHRNFGKDQDIELLLSRIYDKLKLSSGLAEQIKKTRDEETFARNTSYMLRTHLGAAEELFALIDERLQILKERYPVSQSYPGVSPNVLASLEKKRGEIARLNQVSIDLSNAFLGNDIQLATKISRENRPLIKELDDLSDIADNVSDVLKVCERFKKEREQKRIIDNTFVLLPQRIQLLQESLSAAQSSWQKNEKPDGAGQEHELFAMAKTEIKNLKDMRTQLTSLLTQNKEEEAIAIAKPFLQKPQPEIVARLRTLSEQIQDRMKITRAVAIEEQNKKEMKELQGKVETLLSVSKEKFNALSQAKRTWNEAISSLKEESSEGTENLLNASLSSQADKLEAYFTKVITQAEKEINNKDLKKAHHILTIGEKRLGYLDRYSQKILSEQKRISEMKTSALETKKNKLAMASCSRTLQKVEKYISIMEQQLQPLQNEFKSMEREFVPEEKYPQISSSSKQAVEKARKTVEDYRLQVSKAKAFLAKSKFEEATSVLAPFEGKRLEGYSEFMQRIKSIQEDLAQTRSKSEMLKANMKKIEEAEQHIKQLRDTRKDLDVILSQVQEKWESLNKYKASQGYKVPDPNVPKYIEEARMEIKQLGNAAAQGSQLIKEEKYHEAINFLKPYSESIQLGMSTLPLFKTYLKQFQQYLENNEALAKDPGRRLQILREAEEKERRQKLLKSWRRSPGPWYDRMSSLIGEYLSLDKNISNAIEGKGSSLVHDRIKSDCMKVGDYKDFMAELVEMEEIIHKKGRKWPQYPQTFGQKLLLEYLKNEKTIELDVKSEIEEMSQAIDKIKKELRSSWVEEDTLRSFLRAQESIIRKFDEVYLQIKSQLTNLSN